MVEKGSQEWRELTFSQREGKAPLPEVLQEGKLTDKFRNKIWFFIENCMNNSTSYGIYDSEPYFDSKKDRGKYWENFYPFFNVIILAKPHDEIKNIKPTFLKNWLRNIILNGEYHVLITLLEHMLLTPNTPQDLAKDIKTCFKLAPYLIDEGDPLCIIPVTSQEMKECIQQSLQNINQSGLKGAKSHLGNAARALNNNDFDDSIRESIHAVESIAKVIDRKASKTLGSALDSLEKKGVIKHSALRKAFSALYGYTSDEEGIRHALTEEGAAAVGFDEAVFMYAACVAFVDYLARKQKQMEIE